MREDTWGRKRKPINDPLFGSNHLSNYLRISFQDNDSKTSSRLGLECMCHTRPDHPSADNQNVGNQFALFMGKRTKQLVDFDIVQHVLNVFFGDFLVVSVEERRIFKDRSTLRRILLGFLVQLSLDFFSRLKSISVHIVAKVSTNGVQLEIGRKTMGNGRKAAETRTSGQVCLPQRIPFEKGRPHQER